MRGMIRAVMSVLLAAGLWSTVAPVAKADGVEMLMVPSAAMGRDIPVAFQGGGPHAVILLDAFNAGPDVSNWVGAGAFNTLAGKGISVAAPAGGAWSMYTNWEQDGSKQWETFLADELPGWLAANKGLAPNGHGVVGAAQGGYAAMAMAAFHPDRYRYAGSLSGFLDAGANTRRTARSPRGSPSSAASTSATCGVCHSSAAGNGTRRMCTFSCWRTTTPGCGCSARQRTTCSDPAAMIGYCAIAQGTNREFYQHYRTVGGHNGHFDFPPSGEHDWGTWGPQLAAMSGELVTTIK